MTIARSAPVGAPRLGAVLYGREANRFLALIVVVTAAIAIIAAHQVADARAAGIDAGRLLRRFDLTVLALTAFLLVVRTAARIEADHATGWLDPVQAAGASRWQYGPLVAGAAALWAVLIFAGAAATFAVALGVLDGTDEPIRMLARTLAGGILVLSAYGLVTALFGLLLRQAMLTLVAMITLVGLPLSLVYPYLLMDERLPAWLEYGLRASPPITMPYHRGAVIDTVGYVIVAALLLAPVSHRYAGRRT